MDSAEDLSPEEHLCQLWMLYASKNDIGLLRDYIRYFLSNFDEYVDVEFTHLNEGFMPEGPHLTKLPEGLLQAILKQLIPCNQASRQSLEIDILSYAQDLLKCLIIICRNIDNIAFVASCEYVTHIISITTTVLNKLCSENTENVDQLTWFVKHAVHFFECMYDPYFIWRKAIRGWSVDQYKLKFRPALLHVEVVPFFYECFQMPFLDLDIQARLFQMFGAIISGAQHNALRAICPATLDVLLKVLSNTTLGGSTDEQREEVTCLKELVLGCLVRMVHVAHMCSPDQRQVEVGAILEGYLQVLLKMEGEQNSQLQLKMLNSVNEMLECAEKSSLQVIFVATKIYNTLVEFLHKISVSGVEAQMMAMAVVRVLTSATTGSITAKEQFKLCVGYQGFVEALKSLGQPSKELLESLLDLAVEVKFDTFLPLSIRNSQAVLMLVQWLPDIQSHDLQEWLSGCLHQLCAGSYQNRMHCCNDGLILNILKILTREKQINPKAVENLIQIVESLGAISITSTELRHLISLLKLDENNKRSGYSAKLMHAMSVMARKDGKEGPLYYFDFQSEESGLLTCNLGRWPGYGFSFHAWVCLDSQASIVTDLSCLIRRQLYSITTASGFGFEAFFNSESFLVVAVMMKKDYHAIQVSECPIIDQQWHCIDVVHTPSKRPFTQSQLTVYIDGRQRLSAQLKFPPLNEDFVMCKIGCPGIKVSSDRGSDLSSGSHPAGSGDKGSIVSPGSVPGATSPSKSRFSFRNLGLKNPITNLMKVGNTQSLCVLTLDLGSQDEHYGVPVSIVGQLGSVCVFHEAILPTQIKALYALGPNNLTVFQVNSEDPILTDLPQKLVLHYNAKASQQNICFDLSSNQNHGRVVGNKCATCDIRDVINCIGGIQVLTPLLEQVNQENSPEEEVEFTCNSPTPPERKDNSPSPDQDWVVVPSSSYTDSKLEKNHVAGFLSLLRNMVMFSPINQDTLVRENSLASIGMLLRKVDSGLIDVNVLMAIQLLVESVAAVNKTLLQHIYQYLLFDFRIWCKSDFHVRIGHIQYLSTIIKDDKKFFRKKYGVQFMLDVIRIYYSNPQTSKLTAEDNCTIRNSLFGLIKFFVAKEITFEELNCLVGFLLAAREENLVSECLDLVISLLEVPGKKDQIFLLMFEPDMAELLYALLTKKEYGPIIREKLLKLLLLLLKSDKVSDKHKVRLRLLDAGMYPGLISLMAGGQVSWAITKYLLQQILLVDSSASVNAALSVAQLLPHCDIDIKLEASRQLMQALLANSSSPRLFASQIGWQEVLVRLLILKPKTVNTSRRISGISNPVSNVQESEESENSAAANCGISIMVGTLVDVSAPELMTNSSDQSLLDPSLDILRSDTQDDLSSLSSSPKFSKHFFEDMTFFDADYFGTGASSRSSSTSVEDLTTAGGARRSNSIGALSAISSPSDNNLSALLEEGPLEPHDEEGEGSGHLKRWSQKMDLTKDQEEEIASGIQRLGLTSVVRDENMEKTEELCQNLLIILLTVLWKGVEGSDKDAWKARGQVFAAVNSINEDNDLLKPKIEITRKLIELILQGCIMDLKETGQTSSNNMTNAVQLIKHVYRFLCLDDGEPQDKFSERIIEDVLTLLDLLTVWEINNKWMEMEQLGMRILLAYAAQDDLDLCSIAAARLHNLLQTRPVEKLQETCFVMGVIDGILMKSLSLDGNPDHYNYLIPVMKALIDKCTDMLAVETYLPGLPATQMSPSFYDDFKDYCFSEEWRSFMNKQVLPSKNQYEANIFDEISVTMKTFLHDCHEDMMETGHKRLREIGESQLKFKGAIMELFRNRARQENKRFHNTLTQLRNQHSSTQRQWRSTKAFFTGDRGAWAESVQLEVHWRLSAQENFSRMRPKLVPNYGFDPHTDASRLRDNLEPEQSHTELPAIPLGKETKVSDEDIGDDRLGDEEWDLITTASTEKDEDVNGKEKLVLLEDCELITVMEVIKGRLEVTTTHVYFFDSSQQKEDGGGEDFKWALSQLREIHFRRYNLRRSALEFFLIDQSNYFLNFQKKVRNKVYTRILSLRPANLIYYGSRSPVELLKASGLTQKWVCREISNFDYLMQLNTIAGRTYNDLSQYPVFPWILQDYTSEELDLENPNVYRDLSKPIGVVNPKNEKEVREKFEHFEDPSGTIEKFHYGTHYSNAAGVMHYLLRVEPFTTLHIQLQSGRFDVTDRQFHSIPSTWQCLVENPIDVKELTPEFFYFPEFLENHNDFDLGKLQVSKEKIDNVILPKWAKSPGDFISKHMAALESEHVSNHLHHWIDLIFGYKQKGPAAAEALNVFYYCTYEGAVDLDAISDPLQRKAVEGMINNFGQTPCQLLKEAHPQRMSFDEAVHKSARSDKPLSVLLFLNQLKAFCVEAASCEDPLMFICIPRNQARSFIQHGMPDAMVAVTMEGALGLHGWLPYDKSISNFFTFERDATITNPKTKRRLAGPFAPGTKVNSRLFSVTHDAKLVFSGGHWDNSLRVYNISKAKTVAVVVRHTDVVTCLALDHCNNHLISGSRDTTCMIWQISQQSGASSNISSKPVQILYGHDAEVTSVAISLELDLAVSGSKDGTVIIHTVRKGSYLRSLRPQLDLYGGPREGWDLAVQQLAISDIGQICVYCQQTPHTSNDEKLSLHLYSINGAHLFTETVHVPIMDMLVTHRHLVFGNNQGVLVIKELFGLRTLTTMPLRIPITCVAATHGNSHILVGLKDGNLIIVGIKKGSEVK